MYVVPVICSLDLDHLLVCGRFFQGLLDNNNSAGFQQYSIADASMTAKVRLFRCFVGGLGLSYWRLQIPAKLSYEDASTIPVALTISYLEVFRSRFGGMQFTAPPEPSQRGQLAGTPVVGLGGSSSVGHYGESFAHFARGLLIVSFAVIQLARALGLSPIITTASVKHGEYLKFWGATHVVDRSTPIASLHDEIKKKNRQCSH